MKLFEIPMELDKLATTYEQMLAESAGEVTPEIEAVERELATYLEGSNEKIEAAVCVIRNLESDAQQAKDESKRLANRSNAITNNADRLKGLVQSAVEAIGGKVKTARFTCYTQNNPKSYTVTPAPDVDLLELAKTWPDFVRVTAEPRKAELLAAMKDGHTKYPESAFVITENPQTKSLRIK